MLTPNEIENHWIELEKKITAAIERQKFLFGFPAVLLLLLAVLAMPNLPQHFSAKDVNFFLIYSSIGLVVIIAPLAFIANLLFDLPSRALPWAIFFTLVAALYQSPVGSSCSVGNIYSFPFMMFGCLGIAWLHVRGALSRGWALGLSLGLLLGVSLGNTQLFSPPDCIKFFWSSKAQLYSAFLIAFFFQPKEEMRLGLVANPTHLAFSRVFYFPFEDSSREHPFAAGILKLLKAFLVIGAMVVLFRVVDLGPPTSLVRALARHVVTLAGMISLANFCVGMTEICGIKCPTPTYFLPLARSPRDYLKRETIYGYMFCFRFIYLPLLRWLKSPGVAALVFFLSFPVFRDGFQVLFMRPSADLNRVKHMTLLVALWGVWLVGFFLAETPWLRRFFNQNSWRSVFLTQAVMASPRILFWALGWN